jgi:hypothetical protein
MASERQSSQKRERNEEPENFVSHVGEVAKDDARFQAPYCPLHIGNER